MQGSPIRCVFSIDNNYCQHVAVTVASLVANNPGVPFHAHVIHYGLTAENHETLRAFMASLKNFEVDFHLFDPEPYRHFRLDRHISLASYFRLFLTRILPEDVDRVLYLDADLVVLGDVRALWDAPLGSALIGAVVDPFANSPDMTFDGVKAAATSNQRLGLPDDHVYFNAGVLVIDLAAWRREDLLPVFVRFVESHHESLLYHDQDALNAVLRGRVAYLPYIWNFQAKTVAKDAEAIGVPEPMLQKMARQPRIVHYTGAKKPWRYIYHVPFEREYFRYLRRTPWRAYRPPDRTLRTVLGRHLSPLRWAYRKMRPHRMPASVANHA